MTATVSLATRRQLLEAMQRLLAGTPQHTDGRLTKNNLCREAGVSRATMNRASDILATWDAHVSRSPAGTAARRRDDDLDRLRHDLKASRARCRELQHHLDAAATVISLSPRKTTPCAVRTRTRRRAWQSHYGGTPPDDEA